MNKKTFLIIFFSLFIFSCFSQEKITLSKYFLKEYKKHCKEYPVYNGNITILNDTVIQYDDKFIELYTHNDYKPIFYSGIFYPMIVIRDYVFKHKGEYTCVVIWNFREIKIKKLEQSPKIKRFAFSMHCQEDCDIMMVGGDAECLIELRNENATKSTSLADFIAGAKLTLYWLRFIII